VAASAVGGSGGVGPGALANDVTFHPCSHTSDTVSVRHDCCGCTDAPLPTIPTRQIATAAVDGV